MFIKLENCLAYEDVSDFDFGDKIYYLQSKKIKRLETYSEESNIGKSTNAYHTFFCLDITYDNDKNDYFYFLKKEDVDLIVERVITDPPVYVEGFD